jgi:hypothetical protein
MNRQQKRLSQQAGNRLQTKEWNDFEDVTIWAIDKHLSLSPDSKYKPDKVYRNNKYIVQIHYNIERDGRYYTRVMIRRNDSEAIYSWQDLFRIKNEIFGEEIEAIQYFPRKSELVDVANMYWIFIEEKYDEKK